MNRRSEPEEWSRHRRYRSRLPRGCNRRGTGTVEAGMRCTRLVALAAAATLAAAGCAAQDPATTDASGDGLPSGSATPTPSATDESTEPTTEDQDPTMEDQDPARDPGTGQPSPEPGADQPPAETGQVPDRYLEPVLADAADRSGVPQEQLEVTRAQAQQWRSGALGCPKPGMSYTQALVDGYWVELDASGQHLDYRLDGRGNFRLCEKPRTGSLYPDR